jgi:hypothetical protein
MRKFLTKEMKRKKDSVRRLTKKPEDRVAGRRGRGRGKKRWEGPAIFGGGRWAKQNTTSSSSRSVGIPLSDLISPLPFVFDIN